MKQGVPQGSVLGPTLFSIYYDSVHSVITNSSCKLFADDTEIHSSVSIIGSTVDNVNEDLVSIEKWLKENEMVVHPKKSEVMNIPPSFDEHRGCRDQIKQSNIKGS